MTQLAVVVTSKAHPHLVSLVILHQAFLMCWSASLPVGTNELYAPGTRTDTAGYLVKVTRSTGKSSLAAGSEKDKSRQLPLTGGLQLP